MTHAIALLDAALTVVRHMGVALAPHELPPASNGIGRESRGIVVDVLPIPGLSALRALRRGGSLRDKRVMITGATGIVGSLAIELAAASGALQEFPFGPERPHRNAFPLLGGTPSAFAGDLIRLKTAIIFECSTDRTATPLTPQHELRAITVESMEQCGCDGWMVELRQNRKRWSGT